MSGIVYFIAIVWCLIGSALWVRAQGEYGFWKGFAYGPLAWIGMVVACYFILLEERRLERESAEADRRKVEGQRVSGENPTYPGPFRSGSVAGQSVSEDGAMSSAKASTLQTAILVGYALVMAVMMLYPPFYYDLPRWNTGAGHHFVTDTPAFRPQHVGLIAYRTLAVYVAGATLIAGALWLAIHCSRRAS